MHCSFKRVAPFLLLLALLEVLAVNSYAANITWTNAGVDNLASSAANWSGNEVPQDHQLLILKVTGEITATFPMALQL